jgi:uncharacterized damage-inducible protein DinB
MNKQDILSLYWYNQWANAKILNAAAKVTQEQFLADASFPHGGLRSTLTHALFAEWIWRNRWQGHSPTLRIQPQEFPNCDALRLRWMEEENALLQFVESITDEKLNSLLSYKNTRGVAFEQVLWKLMAHVVNHGTQHRSEAAAMLTEYGCSPGDLDMIYFFDAQLA